MERKEGKLTRKVIYSGSTSPDIEMVSNDKTTQDFSGGENVFDIRSEVEELGLASCALPLSKEESIKKVIVGYRYHFQQKLCSQGLTPLHTLHKAAVNEVFQCVVGTNSRINLEYWNEMRLNLLTERQKFEKSAGAIVKAMEMSLVRFKEGYEAGMSAAVLKSITIDPPTGGTSFESFVTTVHEQYIKNYAQQHFDTLAHPILLPLLPQRVESEYRSILSTKHVIKQYQELMTDAISRNVGCSERFLENLHEECMQNTLAAWKSSRKHLVALDRQFMILYRDLYVGEIIQIQRLEMESVWEALKNYYWTEMTNNCQQFYYKSSDITILHEHVVHLCEMAVQKCFNLSAGINVDSIKNRFQELLQQLLEANDLKIENSAKTVGLITSKAEIRFNEMAAGQLCGRGMNDSYFVARALKIKNQILEELRIELGTALPADGGRQFLYLQKFLDSTCERLRQDNVNKLRSEELKGCAAPVTIVQFGAKDFGVGYINNTGGLLTTNCTTSEEKNSNLLCFLKSGEYIFRMTHPENLFDISMEDLLDLPDKESTHPKVEKEIPLDFQLACSLVLTKLLEVMEGRLGKFRSALITVPLWLRSLQRQQLKDAALIAGFQQVFLVNDTSAAMLAHVIDSTTTQGACARGATDIGNEEETLILSGDSHDFTAAVYKHFGEKLTMTFNTGLCHQKLGWRSPYHSRPAPVGPDTVISNVFDNRKNIRHVIILCEEEKLRDEYKKLLLANWKIKWPGPPQPFPPRMGRLVMQGASEYAKRLVQKISEATQLINDLTYYDLEIEDPTLSNKCLMNRNSPLNQRRDSACTVTKNGLTIYESSDGKSKVCCPLDLWTVEEARTEKLTTLTCFANKEGIYEFFVTEGSLKMASQRQRVIEERSLYVQKYFRKRDEQLEEAKGELTAIANFIIENIGSLNMFGIERVRLEANQALNLLLKPNVKKTDILQKLEFLKQLKIQHFGSGN